MHNRDQLTWQMEVTGVTGGTWTCGGNGACTVIEHTADVIAVMATVFYKSKNR